LSVKAVVPPTAIASNPRAASGRDRVLRGRDPLRAASGIRNAAIDGRGELERDERAVGLLSRKEERGILRSSFCSEQPDVCLNAGALQDLDAARASASGSRTAATTRRTPAARIASVQGGVFP